MDFKGVFMLQLCVTIYVFTGEEGRLWVLNEFHDWNKSH